MLYVLTLFFLYKETAILWNLLTWFTVFYNNAVLPSFPSGLHMSLMCRCLSQVILASRQLCV